MEITISEGIVRRAKEAQNTPRVIEARRIASFLSLACQRAGAKIVHNEDAGYVGIRMDTKAGPVVLEVPAEAGGVYRLVNEFVEADDKGRTEREILRIPQIYKAQGIALMSSDFLRSRGFLG
ncbi:hypothetical protein [Streptomyces sp. NPDC020681]|uniref:hypothetical protein n=1 Tax=Streptomyces sp. NPDC020681 TaxID=3365083 RepID=UPI003798060A